MTRRQQLVIFDCDGVLVDSEPIANRVFAEMVGELGLAMTSEDVFERFGGRSMSYCVATVTDMLGRPVPAEFLGDYRSRLGAALEKELRPMPGIAAALDAIGVPYCVASSGDHQKMRTTLGITKLLPRFDGRLFSVTEVARGKPFPDVFLLAAERCGVEPAACAVVEDSPVGVAAGRAAGMRVLGYAAATPRRRLLAAGAHAVFDDMRELPALIGGDPAAGS